MDCSKHQQIVNTEKAVVKKNKIGEFPLVFVINCAQSYRKSHILCYTRIHGNAATEDKTYAN